MKVLITGGAGYIGSHVTHAMIEAGHEVVVLDNFATGQRRALPLSAVVIEGDVGNSELLDRIFSGRQTEIPADGQNDSQNHGQNHDHKNRQFNAVLHFAAHVQVGESVTDPGKYYRGNTVSSLTLFEACRRAKIANVIFSSTAAVYGERSSVAGVGEDAELGPINPYGASKLMSERMLQDLARASSGAMKTVIFRYFNAAGARRDLKIGQATPHATHLIKVAAEVALGLRDGLTLNGTDYPTPDGTCQRDYIHIEDLAQAHLDALTYLAKGGESVILNVGYGQARSVLDVIESMKRVSGRDLKVTKGPRREGDPSVVMADAAKIRRVLGWTPRFNDLDLICRTAFEWEQKLQLLRQSGEWT